MLLNLSQLPLATVIRKVAQLVSISDLLNPQSASLAIRISGLTLA